LSLRENKDRNKLINLLPDEVIRKIDKNKLEQFGAQPSDSDIETYARSKHWNGEIFLNTEPTKIDVNFFTLPQMLYKQFLNRGTRRPSSALPLIPFEKDKYSGY
jgi:hypothetical protein